MQKVPQDIGSLSKREQKALAEILKDPAAWGELFLRNRDGTPHSFWEHDERIAKNPNHFAVVRHVYHIALPAASILDKP